MNKAVDNNFKYRQSAGFSITKRGKLIDNIKSGGDLGVFKELLLEMNNPQFDNNKALWLTIEYNRPEHYKIFMDNQSQVGVSSRIVRVDKKTKKKETILQYALRVADFDTIKEILIHNQESTIIRFPLDHLNTTELQLILNRDRDAEEIFDLMFSLKDVHNNIIPIYQFYDPYNDALLLALKKTPELAKKILYNVHRDHISFNINFNKILDLYINPNEGNKFNQDVYINLFREMIIGKMSRNPKDKQVYRPAIDVNRPYKSNGKTITLIYDVLRHPKLLEIVLNDGRADPNVRINGVGDTPLHIASNIYFGTEKTQPNPALGRSIFQILDRSSARLLINLENRKTLLDDLDGEQMEDFQKESKKHFSSV